MSAVTWGDRIRNGEIVQVPDFEATVEWAEQPALRKMARLRGFRGLLFIPLRRDGATIGVISVTRKEPGAFAAHHVQLLQTFADQAVIAIENARLFDEVQAGPTICEVAAAADRDRRRAQGDQPLAGQDRAGLRQDFSRARGSFAAPNSGTSCCSTVRRGGLKRCTICRKPMQISGERPPSSPAETNLGRVQRTNRPDQVEDVRLGSGYRSRSPLGVATVELGGARTLLTVPLLKEGKVIGGIAFYRTEVRPFTEKQIELLSSFADQAVIAIENVRLFNETQEALARQTATSDILRVISQSPTDVQPVFDAIVLAAVRLLRCDGSFILRCDGATFAAVAAAGPEGPYRVFDPKPRPIDPDADFPSRAIVRKNLHLPDWSLIELPEFERQIQERAAIIARCSCRCCAGMNASA